MSYIIYLRTIKAVFLDEGPTVTALVMVVNGLGVTTEYVYESKCVCVCVYAQSAVVTRGSPTTSIWSVLIYGPVFLSRVWLMWEDQLHSILTESILKNAWVKLLGV